MITQTGGASSGSAMSPYEYAVAGGFTGTEDEFKTALGEGPWLSCRAHDVSTEHGHIGLSVGRRVDTTYISTQYNNNGWLFVDANGIIGSQYWIAFDNTFSDNEFSIGPGIMVGSGYLAGSGTCCFMMSSSGRTYCNNAMTGTFIFDDSGSFNSAGGVVSLGYYNMLGFPHVDPTNRQIKFDRNDRFTYTCILGQNNRVGATGSATTDSVVVIGNSNAICGKRETESVDSDSSINISASCVFGNNNMIGGTTDSSYINMYNVCMLGNRLLWTPSSSGSDVTVTGYVNNPDSTSGRFIVGVGTQNYNSSTGTYSYTGKNGLRVDSTNVYGLTYRSSGADYAEMFQWQDGNLDNEDRAGHFVTLDGEYIKLAGPEDKFVLGIISGNPSIVGDVHDDQWHGIDARDIFGRPIYEDVEVPEETEEIPDPQNPDQTITRVKVPAHTEHRVKTNPDYNPDEKYIPRSQRPEWATVGMMGKLVAVDDGTCQINGYAKVGVEGVATHSDEDTRYRVMARLDDTHIRVLIL